MRNSLSRQSSFLFEEHSSTLPVWWQYCQQHKAKRPLTVVYLDAHLDLQLTDEHKIERLSNCTSLDEVLALETPHHLNPSDRYAFGIENFLYAAKRLGLIERLIWVAPPHIPRRYSAALIDYMQQMDGVHFDELTGFEPVAGNALRGSMLGLDITICDYTDLGSLSIPDSYLLDVDIDYFVEVPADHLWINPAVVINSIFSTIGKPGLTTISRAVSSGFTPLSFRFVGNYVDALVNEDEDGIKLGDLLYSAVALMQGGRIDDAVTRLNDAVERHPDCAAIPYLLGIASNDVKQNSLLKRRAAEVNNAYGFDLSREASGFPHRKRRLDPENLRTLRGLLPKIPADSSHRQYAEIAIGQLLAAANQPAEALSLLPKGGDLAQHGDLLLGVASCMMRGKQPQQAEPMLRKALGYDKLRTTALLYLGELALGRDEPNEAIIYYRGASQRAPAWTLPLERQLQCRIALGQSTEADELTALLKQRRQRIERLLDRHHVTV